LSIAGPAAECAGCTRRRAASLSERSWECDPRKTKLGGPRMRGRHGNQHEADTNRQQAGRHARTRASAAGSRGLLHALLLGLLAGQGRFRGHLRHGDGGVAPAATRVPPALADGHESEDAEGERQHSPGSQSTHGMKRARLVGVVVFRGFAGFVQSGKAARHAGAHEVVGRQVRRVADGRARDTLVPAAVAHLRLGPMPPVPEVPRAVLALPGTA